ncbi:IS1634 family transposase [Thorsellia kenyensis]|uniref:IS1634 family transposase n=1 Tax=Thorsellia kenyensis TaxID=1549888 RepID=UPI00406D4CBD
MLEEKKLSSLMKKNFSCEHDPLSRLEEFKRELKYTEITDYQINSFAQYSGRGAPKKDAEPVGYKYTITANIEICEAKLEEAKLKLGIFILSTNDINNTPDMHKLLSLYKSQQRVEREFRFLKDPSFMTSSFFVEKPSRIEALLFLMAAALMIYAGLEHQIRTTLKENKKTVTNSVKKQTDNPTLKWLFLKFTKIKCLIVDKTTVYIKGID